VGTAPNPTLRAGAHADPSSLLLESAKWVRLPHAHPSDDPGSWETYGYHTTCDPCSTALSGRLTWQARNRRDAVDDTPRSKSLVLDPPAGQGTSPASTSTFAFSSRTDIMQAASYSMRPHPESAQPRF